MVAGACEKSTRTRSDVTRAAQTHVAAQLLQDHDIAAFHLEVSPKVGGQHQPAALTYVNEVALSRVRLSAAHAESVPHLQSVGQHSFAG